MVYWCGGCGLVVGWLSEFVFCGMSFGWLAWLTGLVGVW